MLTLRRVYHVKHSALGVAFIFIIAVIGSVNYTYFAAPPALRVMSSPDYVSRSILLLRGWQVIYGDIFDKPFTEVTCPCQHHFTVKRTYWVEPDASDVVIFYDHELTSTPPRKILGQLWEYHA